MKISKKEYMKKYREENRERIRKQVKEYGYKYREENKNKLRERRKINRIKNLLKIREREKLNEIKKRKDPIYCFARRITTNINSTYYRKNVKKPSMSFEEIVGCDRKFLINYLVKTYENRYNEKFVWKFEFLKGIEIDHIIPISNNRKVEYITKLNHYKNLQLLKKHDNKMKADNLLYEISY